MSKDFDVVKNEKQIHSLGKIENENNKKSNEHKMTMEKVALSCLILLFL